MTLDTAEQRELTVVDEEVGADASGEHGASASFGADRGGAIYAIVFSLCLVVVYIWIRFQWKFGVAAIAALLHDVLIAVGIYSLYGLEVTTATVAAILTVLGYLDLRLDHHPGPHPREHSADACASFREIANMSLWETIRRSLATTFITLLPIIALYFFGGEPEGLRVRPARRDRVGGVLVDLPRAPPSSSWPKEREPEYAGARRPTLPEDDLLIAGGSDARRRRGRARDRAPFAGPPRERPSGDGAAAKRERRRQRRRRVSPWQSPLAPRGTSSRRSSEWARDETGKAPERARLGQHLERAAFASSGS